MAERGSHARAGAVEVDLERHVKKIQLKCISFFDQKGIREGLEKLIIKFAWPYKVTASIREFAHHSYNNKISFNNYDIGMNRTTAMSEFLTDLQNGTMNAECGKWYNHGKATLVQIFPLML